MKIHEDGPWYAVQSTEPNDRWTNVWSRDFTHDASLTITGDFESDEQRLAYAEEIARRLNSFAERDAALERVRVLEEAVQELPHVAWCSCKQTDWNRATLKFEVRGPCNCPKSRVG